VGVLAIVFSQYYLPPDCYKQLKVRAAAELHTQRALLLVEAMELDRVGPWAADDARLALCGSMQTYIEHLDITLPSINISLPSVPSGVFATEELVPFPLLPPPLSIHDRHAKPPATHV
jgi:hypothetical protein